MFLAEPPPTQYDLRFNAVGVAVRVHPFFWLVTGMMAFQGRMPMQAVILWVGCVFVSILIHELGHALTAKFFGADSAHIVLYGMGGLAISSGERTRWQRLLGILAGPGAGFVFYGILLLLARQFESRLFSSPQARLIFDFLEFINLFWGLVNLLPVWPLDGGQACATILEMVGVRQVTRWTQSISLTAATLTAVFFMSRGQYFATFLFGYLAVASLQWLMNHPRGGYDDDRSPWR